MKRQGLLWLIVLEVPVHGQVDLLLLSSDGPAGRECEREQGCLLHGQDTKGRQSRPRRRVPVSPPACASPPPTAQRAGEQATNIWAFGDILHPNHGHCPQKITEVLENCWFLSLILGLLFQNR